jgi:hypothetical protein
MDSLKQCWTQLRGLHIRLLKETNNSGLSIYTNPQLFCSSLGSADELGLALFLHWTQGSPKHQLQTADVHELWLLVNMPSKLPEPLCYYKTLRMEKNAVVPQAQ